MKGKLIGRGTFTKAYMWGAKQVLLISEDHIKEAMAHGWFPESRLFPEIKYTETDGEYIMDYYPRVSSLKNALDPEEYQLYQELRYIFSNRAYVANPYDLYHYWYEVFGEYPFSHSEAEDIREALQEALNACGNWGTDICFEISPRNVAVKDGKLVLLDCFFIRKQLAKKMEIK